MPQKSQQVILFLALITVSSIFAANLAKKNTVQILSDSFTESLTLGEPLQPLTIFPNQILTIPGTESITEPIKVINY